MLHSFRQSIPLPSKPRNIELGKYEFHKLSNGLDIIVVEDHKLPIVNIKLGLRNKPQLQAQLKGIESLTGAMLGRGTKYKSKLDYHRALEFYGTNVGFNKAGFSTNVLTQYTEEVFDLAVEALLHPAFDEEELTKEIAQLNAGLQQVAFDAESIAANICNKINYGDLHPYGEIVTTENIAHFNKAEIINYYEKYFIPNNAVLIFVGDISLAAAVNLAQSRLSSWEARPFHEVDYKIPFLPQSTNFNIASKPSAVQTVIHVTYPLELHPTDVDITKISLTNKILGGGVFAARLFQNLREKNAYTYGAYSSLHADQICAHFDARGSVKSETFELAINEIFHEMRNMQNEMVSKSEMDVIRNSMIGDFGRSLEHSGTLARFAFSILHYGLPEDYYSTYIERLMSVSENDIMEMANKIFMPERSNVVCIGDLNTIEKAIHSQFPNSKISLFGPFGERIEQ